MAGSLDDNPPDLLGYRTLNYIVFGRDIARILVSEDSVLTREQMAQQLRDLAHYLDTMPPPECDCE